MTAKQKQRSTRPKQATRRATKGGFKLRFSVLVEFLVGLIGIYGIGRLLAGRTKEARIFLIASLLLIVPLDFTPRLIGDQYALWAPWLAKFVLSALSAAHLNFVLDRA
ncbi:MAG: hypothetical protein GXX93_01865 [Anaerolineae bacterium]|nr:hypothetical protein [Anaerolineae bacterium]